MAGSARAGGKGALATVIASAAKKQLSARLPGGAKQRTPIWNCTSENLEIPRCAIAHLRSGAYAPSRNDDVQTPKKNARRPRVLSVSDNKRRGYAACLCMAPADEAVPRIALIERSMRPHTRVMR